MAGRHGVAYTARVIIIAATILAGTLGVATARASAGRSVLHTVSEPAYAVAVAVDARRGRVFVAKAGVEGGTVSVLDSSSGAVLRTTRVGSEPLSLAVDERAGTVFVPSFGNRTVSILDARTGRVRSTVDLGGDRGPMAVAIDERTGHVFVVNQYDNSVSMLDAVTGVVIGTIRLGGPGHAYPRSIVVDEQTARVFVGNDRGAISALDTRTGNLLHTVQLADESDEPTFLGEDIRTGRIFVADPNESRIYTLGARSGRIVRMVQTPVGSGVCTGQAMAVDERTDRVFVPLCVTNVAILDAATGRLIRSVRVAGGPTVVADELVGGPIAVAVDERVGHAFVVSYSEGTLSLLDARTGAVRRTVAVGYRPLALAVDEMTGRVFVANSGDGTVRVVDATSGRVRATIGLG